MRWYQTKSLYRWLPFLGLAIVIAFIVAPAQTQEKAPKGKEAGPQPSSYDQVSPVLLGQESFNQMMARDKAQKDKIAARQKALLEERYDLTERVDKKVTMSRGK